MTLVSERFVKVAWKNDSLPKRREHDAIPSHLLSLMSVVQSGVRCKRNAKTSVKGQVPTCRSFLLGGWGVSSFFLFP